MHSLRLHGQQNQTFLQSFKSSCNKSGSESMLFGGLAAGAKTFLKHYAAPLIGFAIGFFFLRLLCNTLFKDSDNKIIKACKDFEKKFPWLTPLFMLVTTLYFAPKFADNKLAKDPTFWAGIVGGGFLGTTFTSQKQN